MIYLSLAPMSNRHIHHLEAALLFCPYTNYHPWHIIINLFLYPHHELQTALNRLTWQCKKHTEVYCNTPMLLFPHIDLQLAVFQTCPYPAAAGKHWVTPIPTLPSNWWHINLRPLKMHTWFILTFYHISLLIKTQRHNISPVHNQMEA